MSDKLYPLDLRRLLKWILEEEKQGSIFGVQKDLFFTPDPQDFFRTQRYGRLLETPIGVAAGPHTQMAQNIVLSWLMGARYIELKTIQTLDKLEVSKPCIDMQDEGYNCEWSQELLISQSIDDYLNAWILIHILKDKFAWGTEQDLGVIFDLSAGYDLAGILKPNVQHFLNKMENCQPELDNRLDSIADLYPGVKNLNIPSRISDSLTLSTMHGCPPGEIEKICLYLIEERGYHTTIKLNPTLLGPDRLRNILNNRLGYKDVIVPDEAFDHDLKYPEALKLIKNLQASAHQHGVKFGLKLTNTLEVENHKTIFPTREAMMYMSGRALHPVSINLAAKLQHDFKGKLDISFSAGIEAFNVADVLAANIRPITICTDILKPGGYLRLSQYLEEINSRFAEKGAHSIDQYILNSAGAEFDVEQAGLKNLISYAYAVLSQTAYQKQNKHFESIKTGRKLTAYDCVQAPCIDACATDQDIPEYMYHTARGDFDRAYEVILKTNPLPGVTGYVCDHLCQTKCTRNNLDNTLLIREIKRFATENSADNFPTHRPPNGLKIAVIGAGPSGLTCAYFLSLDGFEVHIYESKPFAGGMVSDAIPGFRLPDETVDNDLELILSLGVEIHYSTNIDKPRFKELQAEFDYIYLAAGAQNNKKLGIEGEDLPNVVEPLTFLSRVRQGSSESVGHRVAVIGGGNTAMDAARTSRRMGADVTILYRRTMKEMPADMEEVVAALEEGINLEELTAPEKIRTGGKGSLILTSSRMELGKPDASGRARPIKIPDSDFDLIFDTIIPSIGQDIAFDFLSWEDLKVNSVTGETRISHLFAGGDAVRGASSVINAVGDGRDAARRIIEATQTQERQNSGQAKLRLDKADYQKKLAHREFGISPPHLVPEDRQNFDLVTRTLDKSEAMAEAERCLLCDDVCDICIGVCPNLANISYMAKAKDYPVLKLTKTDLGFDYVQRGTFRMSQEPQILNIGDFCNECGNCTTFCPTAGDPYLDKPRFFLTKESFDAEQSGYWFDGDVLHYKSQGSEAFLQLDRGNFIYHDKEVEATVDVDLKKVKSVSFFGNSDEVDLSRLAEMAALFESLKDIPLLKAVNA